ncbi:MAG: sigma-54-dependent Fis family transcriptional regulator [Hydrogenibacillus schlegelii]|nr:sigma-54-dependent Fis family transcriptional regulator [Hydrogenibacillus schlegelii]
MGEELALLSPQEIQDKKRALWRAWEAYVSDRRVESGLRASVLESWKRSQSLGIQPEQKKARYLHEIDEIIEWRRQSEFFLTAIPVLEHIFDQIKVTNHLLTLTDAGGRIIYLQGEHSILKKAETMLFVLGADWSEPSVGTNAIGTSLYLQKPIQIFSYEHFAQAAHDWVCSAAPVTDPHSGQVLGIVDLTAPYEYAQPHTLGIAKMIAVQIQKEYTRISDNLRKHLYDEYMNARKRWPGEPILLFDSALQLLTQSPEAQATLQELQKRHSSRSILAVIRETLLTCPELEYSFELTDTDYEATAVVLIRKNERIGFLVLLRRRSRLRRVSAPSTRPVLHTPWDTIIGSSPAMQHAIQRAKIVAATDVPVLITGESGTGKERFAQAIHEASTRSQHPFVAVNIAAIPRELIASELFGYEPGAFTGANPKGKKGKFEEAQGGTLFLDEIGDMPLELQVYLLRVLQEKKIMRLGSSNARLVDVRIIAATNHNLAERIAQGAFRLDLFYRLNVVEIALPPLRERAQDILLLAEFFLDKFAKQYGKSAASFDSDVVRLFERYAWPGNVRELQNVVEHAVIFSTGNVISLNHLPSYLLNEAPDSDSLPLDPLEREEKKMIDYWLQKANGNVSEVARRLNRSRATIYRKIKQYGINLSKYSNTD